MVALQQTPSFALVGMPRLGAPAPQFEARSTHGMIRLEDYAGKWVVLFSHPGDFTPVCTTEFIAFAREHATFAALNCALIGLSVDSVHAHLAWIRDIESSTGVRIPFPVIADLNKEVATLYGMVMPAETRTETVRSLFVIDDRQIVRAMLYYPNTTGRSIPEVLRLVRALQTSDAHGVATPANWARGSEVILPAPDTQDAAERAAQDAVQEPWYLRMMELPQTR